MALSAAVGCRSHIVLCHRSKIAQHHSPVRNRNRKPQHLNQQKPSPVHNPGETVSIKDTALRHQNSNNRSQIPA
jgi:hypothetical protein